MLTVKGITYHFSDHALDQMERRSVPEDWIRLTIAEPDDEPEYDEERDNYRYQKVFRHQNLVHRVMVVVDHTNRTIVTVMYRD